MYTDTQYLLEYIPMNLSKLKTAANLFLNKHKMHILFNCYPKIKCTYLLCVSCCLCVILIIAVTVVP